MSYQPRPVLKLTSSGRLPRNARPLNRRSGSGCMINSGPVVKNSIQSCLKQPASRNLIYLSDDMRKTFNEFAVAYFGGMETTFDEFEPVMVQHINDYLSIRTDFSTLQLTVFKNGIEIDWKDCSGLSLDGCRDLLLTLMMLHTQGITEVRNG